MKKSRQSQKGLGLVLSRNHFYQDHYVSASLTFFIVLVVNALLIFSISYKVTHPPQPKYFAITPDGRIVNSRALTDPDVTNSYVLQWTADAVRKSFSQDYLHYRGQLQAAADYFTPSGWKDFRAAVDKSNNLRTLVTKKMVSDVKITKPPTIVQETVVGGHYAWKINMSIMVTYQGSDSPINMPYEVTIIVVREPVGDYPDKIAINNFLPTLVSTTTN